MALLGKFAVASATVTADSDDVEVYVIPITEMERLFNVEPGKKKKSWKFDGFDS